MQKVSKDSIYQVFIPGNYYAGKYYDYSSKKIYVLADSPEDAFEVVKSNIDKIVNRFASMKYIGRKILKQTPSPRQNLFFDRLDVDSFEPMKGQGFFSGNILSKDGYVSVSTEESNNESLDILDKISKIIK